MDKTKSNEFYNYELMQIEKLKMLKRQNMLDQYLDEMLFDEKYQLFITLQQKNNIDYIMTNDADTAYEEYEKIPKDELELLKILEKRVKKEKNKKVEFEDEDYKKFDKDAKYEGRLNHAVTEESEIKYWGLLNTMQHKTPVELTQYIAALTIDERKKMASRLWEEMHYMQDYSPEKAQLLEALEHSAPRKEDKKSMFDKLFKK